MHGLNRCNRDHNMGFSIICSWSHFMSIWVLTHPSLPICPGSLSQKKKVHEWFLIVASKVQSETCDIRHLRRCCTLGVLPFWVAPFQTSTSTQIPLSFHSINYSNPLFRTKSSKCWKWLSMEAQYGDTTHIIRTVGLYEQQEVLWSQLL